MFLVEDVKLVPLTLHDWKHALAEGNPIIFGISLYESFDSHRRKGLVPMPSRKEASREDHGGHAMLCVGYSDADRTFIVRNSWGRSWGDKGYCYIPYDYLISEKFNDADSWIIKRLDNFPDGDQEGWGEEESVIEESNTEFSKMTDEEYTDMLDAMGYIILNIG
ncbi:MAG: C1 family peptidase [Blastocatellia bacterium]|nr:C1 family peptidase [Blastocatellia bacterium]